MASSNIKLFDENKGNMLSDSEFSISNQRMNGLQTGVASSQLQNKAMYQASLVAYAIAQVMMQNGLNANDTDAVSAFVANLSGTMLQKVYDIATTAEAQAGVATGKWMSPALVKAAIDYMKANTAEAQAGTDDTKWMSPALVKAAIDHKFANAVTFGNTVTLARDPTENLQAATKQYVDKRDRSNFDTLVMMMLAGNLNDLTVSKTVHATYSATAKVWEKSTNDNLSYQFIVPENNLLYSISGTTLPSTLTTSSYAYMKSCKMNVFVNDKVIGTLGKGSLNNDGYPKNGTIYAIGGSSFDLLAWPGDIVKVVQTPTVIANGSRNAYALDSVTGSFQLTIGVIEMAS